MPKLPTIGKNVFNVSLGASLCLLVLAGGLQAAGKRRERLGALWDSQRYIGVDEVKPGMEAYCLTDYGEAGIEKFELKVVEVVRDIEPGRNAILVMGLDDRFKYTGIVGGCSGSPVYIDRRLAGATSFGWTFSKDPLYGVTPIEEMLEVGLAGGSGDSGNPSRPAAFAFDFSRPIDLAEVDRQITSRRLLGPAATSGATALPCPLLVSGPPAEVCRQLAGQLETLGFMAVPGLSGSVESAEGPATLTPGATLTMPLVTGDMKMEVLGAVTEVRDGRVYAFGHSYLGFGPSNLPMAGGKIYTVVSSMMRSFKLGTSTDIIGAITADESGAIVGRLGAKPDMIPASIHVERFNVLEPRTYHCQVAYHQALTPQLIRAVIAGGAYQVGPFPLDHCLEYKGRIDLDDGQSIRFGNTSANMDLIEPAAEISAALGLLMNNPFGGAAVEGLEFDLRVLPRNITAYVWSVDVADPKVKPGETIEAEVVIESFLKQKKRYQVSIKVPENVSDGKYNLMFLGVYEYENFLRKSVPYRFLATNYQTLVDALNAALNVNRTKLYCLLALPPDGITLEKAELPGLPGTKALVLQSDKRAVPVQPYPHWIETTVETGTVIADKEMVPVTVEK